MCCQDHSTGNDPRHIRNTKFHTMARRHDTTLETVNRECKHANSSTPSITARVGRTHSLSLLSVGHSREGLSLNLCPKKRFVYNSGFVVGAINFSMSQHAHHKTAKDESLRDVIYVRCDCTVCFAIVGLISSGTLCLPSELVSCQTKTKVQQPDQKSPRPMY